MGNPAAWREGSRDNPGFCTVHAEGNEVGGVGGLPPTFWGGLGGNVPTGVYEGMDPLMWPIPAERDACAAEIFFDFMQIL